jgi:hypothetical protein
MNLKRIIIASALSLLASRVEFADAGKAYVTSQEAE